MKKIKLLKIEREEEFKKKKKAANLLGLERIAIKKEADINFKEKLEKLFEKQIKIEKQFLMNQEMKEKEKKDKIFMKTCLMDQKQELSKKKMKKIEKKKLEDYENKNKIREEKYNNTIKVFS